MTIDFEIDDIVDDIHDKPDFRRANGTPMIQDREGKNQRFSRPSGWGKALDDENALVNWKLNRAIEGVAGDPALQARAVAAKPDDRKTWNDLREAAINAGRGDQGADIGTAIHAMSERWEDPDDDFDPGEPFASFLASYSAELERLGLISHKVEVKMVNEQYRAAGTCDRIYCLTRSLITPDGDILPVGTLVAGDLKTGKSLDFSLPGYTVQLAIYAGGSFYDVTKDEFVSTPDINQKWGLIVHIPSNLEPAEARCEMVWVDLELGHWGAYLTQQIRQWRKDWKNGTHSGTEALGPELVEMGRVQELAEADAEWLEQMVPYVQERLSLIKENPEARKRLQILWPDDISPAELREGKVSVEKMVEAHHVIARVEADFEISFIPGAPSTEGQETQATTPPSARQMELLPQEEAQ